MPGDRELARALVRPAAAVAFAALYLALALLSREAPGVAVDSLVRPAGGIAVLWLLLRQAGTFSVDTLLLAVVAGVANSLAGAEPLLAASVAATNVVQTLVVVWLLRWWCPRLWGCGGTRSLDQPRVLARYAAAIALGMAAGALLTTPVLALLQPDFTASEGVLWFARNLCSGLTWVTVGLLVGQRLSSPRPRPPLLDAARPIELVGAIVATVLTYGAAFEFSELPLAFVLLGATVWFGLRFSTLLSALHSFTIGVVTLSLTVDGLGPFAVADHPDIGYLIVQFYLIVIMGVGLFLATSRDERQLLAAELRRSEGDAIYESTVRDAVIGSITEGLIVVDETGELLLQNDAASMLLGDNVRPMTAEQDRQVASHWSIDGREIEHDQRPTARALRGETINGAEVVIRVDGRPDRVLNVSGIPLPRDEVRDRARAMILFRDVTRDHAQRAELASFAGVVAHDLRNPLAAIDGWTEMIADELDAGDLSPETAREFVSRVRTSSRRMRELIRDLLAHATSGSRDLEETRVDLAALVREVAVGRNADGRVVCDPVPPVLADAVLVRQVVDNLIGNALKYVAPDVEPKVTVCGWRSSRRMVTVQVADNGIGIPAEEREQIFEEFHRAHYRDYEGSGLGLSIVRRIVSRH